MTLPGVWENQVGTPGKRTGPCGLSTVWKNPTASSCGSSNNAAGEDNADAGISKPAEQIQPLLGGALGERLSQQCIHGVDLTGPPLPASRTARCSMPVARHR